MNFLDERCVVCGHKRRDHGLGGGRCNHKTSKSTITRPIYDCNCMAFQSKHRKQDAEVSEIVRELDELKSHSGRCVECNTYTCGYCGLHNGQGEWRCGKCHFGEWKDENAALKAKNKRLKAEAEELRRQLADYKQWKAELEKWNG